jgi:hypothetical protein
MTKIIVKVLFRKKNAILVEYAEGDIFKRVSLPVSAVKLDADKAHASISKEVLEAGIDYGVPWASKLPDFTVKGTDIENELHKVGIWTIEDYLRRPQDVNGAILSAAKQIAQTIRIIAKETSNKED